uniref:GST C-terminal domain-containing protein n=1 Tax=Panagrolaimus davidi TaxID=227884 RepID=A0A914QC50_9BILA
MLEWNTKKINDGDAILRMIAKMCGLSGQGIFEQAQADAIFSAMNALVFSIVEYVKIKLSSKHQTNFETFNGMYFTIFEPAIRKYFGILEEYASKQTSNGFFLSSGISFVDFAMFHLFDFLQKLHPNLFKQFPKCQAIVYRVSNLPKFQKYLKVKQKPLH